MLIAAALLCNTRFVSPTLSQLASVTPAGFQNLLQEPYTADIRKEQDGVTVHLTFSKSGVEAYSWIWYSKKFPKPEEGSSEDEFKARALKYFLNAHSFTFSYPVSLSRPFSTFSEFEGVLGLGPLEVLRPPSCHLDISEPSPNWFGAYRPVDKKVNCIVSAWPERTIKSDFKFSRVNPWKTPSYWALEYFPGRFGSFTNFELPSVLRVELGADSDAIAAYKEWKSARLQAVHTMASVPRGSLMAIPGPNYTPETADDSASGIAWLLWMGSNMGDELTIRTPVPSGTYDVSLRVGIGQDMGVFTFRQLGGPETTPIDLFGAKFGPRQILLSKVKAVGNVATIIAKRVGDNPASRALFPEGKGLLDLFDLTFTKSIERPSSRKKRQRP